MKIASFGSAQNDISNSITHIDNNIYLCGGFRNTISFGNINLSSAGERDGFLAVLDTNLAVINAVSFGGPQMEEAFRVKAEKEDVFVVGSFQPGCDFTTSENSYKPITIGQIDAYITKYDKEANWVWTQTLGGFDDNLALGIDITDSTIFTSGLFTISSSFDSVYGLNSNLTNAGFNGFIAELKDCHISTALAFNEGRLHTSERRKVSMV